MSSIINQHIAKHTVVIPLLLTDKWRNEQTKDILILDQLSWSSDQSLWLNTALTRNIPPINGVCSPLLRDTMKYSQFF